MKTATEILEDEHRTIHTAVVLMSRLASELESGHRIETSLLARAVQFMRVFGAQCHETKEETCLFTLLKSKGVPDEGCPLAGLTGEHRKLRMLLDQLERSSAAYKKGTDNAAPALIECLRALADLQSKHVWKEEYLLFPMTNKILSPEDQQHLLRQFESLESRIGLDVHRTMQSMITSADCQPDTQPEIDHNIEPEPVCSVCGS